MLAMLPLQATPWLPTFVTPLWILGVGIAAGLAVSVVVLLVLAILSRIPGLGTLADNSRRANFSAAAIALLVMGVTLAIFLPQTNSEYRILMLLPVAAFSIIVGWGVVFGMWRRSISELWSIFSEGVMAYLMGTIVLMMVIGLSLTPLSRDTEAVLNSLPQYNWFDAGQRDTPVSVPGSVVDDPDDAPFVQAVIDYDWGGVESFEIETDRTIIIGDAQDPRDFSRPPTRIEPDSPFRWKRGDMVLTPLTLVPNANEEIWIQNREIDEANVVFRIVSQPVVPEVATIVTTGFSVLLFVLGTIAFRQAAPRVSAISLATAKSEMAQPLYLVLLALGAVAIVLLMILPFHTLGEDIKVLKDSGMTLIMVLGLFQAVWSAGTSVSEEIEGRTALTVLSKPVSRRSFLLGKYAGIMLAILVLFLILGFLLMTVTSYKPIFEARENSGEQPGWQIAHMEMVSVVPGLTLYFMETMAIAAIGVALATRLAMLANFVICLTVYVIGNLTALLVQSSAGNTELVGFIGKLIAVVVPNLNAFNVQAAVDVGNPIPPIYLAGAFNYLVCFGIMALMLALLLFEDRDLA